LKKKKEEPFSTVLSARRRSRAGNIIRRKKHRIRFTYYPKADLCKERAT